MTTISFARHQFPPAIIRHTVWLYLRFTLSYRDVEDLLAERGLDVSYESVRRVAAPLLEARVADRPNWTLTRLIGEIEAREGVTISKSRLSKVLRKKFRWRRPRHTLKGRQDAGAIDRVGLRLALRKAQAEAGDIVLIFADESERADASLSGQSVGQAWRRFSRVPAPGQAKKVAMLGALDHAARRLVVHTNKTKRSADFIALLGRLDVRDHAAGASSSSHRLDHG